MNRDQRVQALRAALNQRIVALSEYRSTASSTMAAHATYSEVRSPDGARAIVSVALYRHFDCAWAPPR